MNRSQLNWRQVVIGAVVIAVSAVICVPIAGLISLLYWPVFVISEHLEPSEIASGEAMAEMTELIGIVAGLTGGCWWVVRMAVRKRACGPWIALWRPRWHGITAGVGATAVIHLSFAVIAIEQVDSATSALTHVPKAIGQAAGPLLLLGVPLGALFGVALGGPAGWLWYRAHPREHRPASPMTSTYRTSRRAVAVASLVLGLIVGLVISQGGGLVGTIIVAAICAWLIYAFGETIHLATQAWKEKLAGRSAGAIPCHDESALPTRSTE